MQARSWSGFSVILLVLSLLTGCHLPAQIVWSPDGAAAVYRGDSKLYLLDSNGKVFSDLGKSEGGFAWSHDSKSLYYINETDNDDATVSPDEAWLISTGNVTVSNGSNGSATTQPAAPADPSVTAKKEFVELKSLVAGKTTLLARFKGAVLHMALSPDENWLAIVGMGQDPTDGFCIYAYHLPTKHLYLLSNNAGMALCFTGASRLMVEEQDTRASNMTNVPGKLIELTLDAKAPPKSEEMLGIIPNETSWMAALGDNVLFTSVSRVFPGKVVDKDKDAPSKLFQWTRANGGVVSIADDVGPLFAVSPDGQRVLIERIAPAEDKSKEKHTLEVIRANGSDGHVLRDLTPYDEFALWPAWRGNDEITFTNPAADGKRVTAGDKVHIRYDVVHYQLTDKSELQPLRTLSDSWSDEMKPFVEIDAPTTEASEPTTKP